MSDRDIIAAHSFTEYEWGGGFCKCGHTWDDQRWREHHALHADRVAATLREARTVRTVEGLARLPEGTGVAFFHDDTGELFNSEIYHVGADGLPRGFDEGGLSFWLADMHARVLYRPDEDGAQ